MNRRNAKKWALTRRILTYAGMTLLVFVAVSGIVLFLLGFRLNLESGQLEQSALLQFGSTPSGAAIAIDGIALNARTPAKTTIDAGTHDFSIWRDGYETWQKTVDVKAGALTWLNYALLVPKELPVEPVATYTSLASSLSSPEGRSILVQADASMPDFTLVDITSDNIKSINLSLDVETYSGASKHTFTPVKWDSGGRYVLIKHIFDDNSEWLVLDTQNPSASKNITRTFDFAIKNIDFSGTSGNEYYVLGNNDVRKLDLSAGTISRPLVNNVIEFSVYESNIVTYVAGGDKPNERIVGLYREGDNNPHILKVVNLDLKVPLHVTTTRYFNENYVAISEGSKVTILSGSYPTTASDDATSLKTFANFTAGRDIANLSFSPTGEYVFVQSGSYFASFDLEYQVFAESNIAGKGTARQVKWLDDNYIWSDLGGELTIREFDGANVHTINSVLAGQDVILTHNGRFLYSFAGTDTGFNLQRVRMILP